MMDSNFVKRDPEEVSGGALSPLSAVSGQFRRRRSLSFNDIANIIKEKGKKFDAVKKDLKKAQTQLDERNAELVLLRQRLKEAEINQVKLVDEHKEDILNMEKLMELKDRAFNAKFLEHANLEKIIKASEKPI